MERIPFDLQYRPQIEYGEYRVVTDMGEPVEIVKWNCRGRCPILAVIDDGDTDDCCFYKDDGVSLNGADSLYIIIDEPDSNEFENALADILMYREYEGPDETEDDLEKGSQPFKEAAREIAPQLLSIARKGFMKDIPKLRIFWKTADHPQIIDDKLVIGDYFIELSDIARLPKEETSESSNNEKPTNSKFKVGDRIVKKSNGTEFWTVEGVDEEKGEYHIRNMFIVNGLCFDDQDDWEIVEQNN